MDENDIREFIGEFLNRLRDLGKKSKVAERAATKLELHKKLLDAELSILEIIDYPPRLVEQGKMNQEKLPRLGRELQRFSEGVTKMSNVLSTFDIEKEDIPENIGEDIENFTEEIHSFTNNIKRAWDVVTINTCLN